jgi:hypothetical protein
MQHTRDKMFCCFRKPCFVLSIARDVFVILPETQIDMTPTARRVLVNFRKKTCDETIFASYASSRFSKDNLIVSSTKPVAVANRKFLLAWTRLGIVMFMLLVMA